MNFVYLIFKFLKENKPFGMFHIQLYRILFDCSKYQVIATQMSEAAAPEFMMYLMNIKHAEMYENLDIQSPPVELDSVFKGYVKPGQQKRVLSIEEINWEKMADQKVKPEFKLNYSYLVATICQVILSHWKNHQETAN